MCLSLVGGQRLGETSHTAPRGAVHNVHDKAKEGQCFCQSTIPSYKHLMYCNKGLATGLVCGHSFCLLTDWCSVIFVLSCSSLCSTLRRIWDHHKTSIVLLSLLFTAMYHEVCDQHSAWLHYVLYMLSHQIHPSWEWPYDGKHCMAYVTKYWTLAYRQLGIYILHIYYNLYSYVGGHTMNICIFCDHTLDSYIYVTMHWTVTYCMWPYTEQIQILCDHTLDICYVTIHWTVTQYILLGHILESYIFHLTVV